MPEWLTKFSFQALWSFLKWPLILLFAYLILTSAFEFYAKITKESETVNRPNIPPVDYCVDRNRLQCVFNRAPEAVDYCTKEWKPEGKCVQQKSVSKP